MAQVYRRPDAPCPPPSPLSGEAPLPDEPTQAQPGSAEKIKIMQSRSKQHQQLFHPDDGKDLARAPHPRTGGGTPTGGVRPWRRKWRAEVWDGALKKKRLVGLFASKEEALRAVKMAKEEMAARAVG